jgi:hypothetical protein
METRPSKSLGRRLTIWLRYDNNARRLPNGLHRVQRAARERTMRQETAAVATAPALVAERPIPYLRHLLFFICGATLFEGYDVLIINLALPYL